MRYPGAIHTAWLLFRHYRRNDIVMLRLILKTRHGQPYLTLAPLAALRSLALTTAERRAAWGEAHHNYRLAMSGAFHGRK